MTVQLCFRNRTEGREFTGFRVRHAELIHEGQLVKIRKQNFRLPFTGQSFRIMLYYVVVIACCILIKLVILLVFYLIHRYFVNATVNNMFYSILVNIVVNNLIV